MLISDILLNGASQVKFNQGGTLVNKTTTPTTCYIAPLGVGVQSGLNSR